MDTPAELSLHSCILSVARGLAGSPAARQTVQASRNWMTLRQAGMFIEQRLPDEVLFMFRREIPIELRQRMLEPRLPNLPLTLGELTRPIHVRNDASSAPARIPLTREQKLRLWNRFEDDFRPGSDPHVVTLLSPLFEGKLPGINIRVMLSLIDGSSTDPEQSIETLAVYDTEAPTTIISAGLVDPAMLDSLRSQANAISTNDDGFVQAAIAISFTNTNIVLDTIALVRPQDKMPNGLNGIIFGQHGGIDSLVTKTTPRAFLPSLEDGCWGEIQIHKVIDRVEEKILEFEDQK